MEAISAAVLNREEEEEKFASSALKKIYSLIIRMCRHSTLMFGAGTGHTAGQNLPTFRNKLSERRHILIIRL